MFLANTLNQATARIASSPLLVLVIGSWAFCQSCGSRCIPRICTSLSQCLCVVCVPFWMSKDSFKRWPPTQERWPPTQHLFNPLQLTGNCANLCVLFGTWHSDWVPIPAALQDETPAHFSDPARHTAGASNVTTAGDLHFEAWANSVTEVRTNRCGKRSGAERWGVQWLTVGKESRMFVDGFLAHAEFNLLVN